MEKIVYELMVFEDLEHLIRLERMMILEYGSEVNYIVSGHGEYDGHKTLKFDTRQERDEMKLKLAEAGISSHPMDAIYCS